MSVQPSRLERIAVARAGFVVRAQEDAALLTSHADRVRDGDTDALGDVRRLVHRLHGTAGSYGFAEASTAAAELGAAIDDHAAPERIDDLLRLTIDTLRRMGEPTGTSR